jgi:hypothetical protein
MSQGSPASFGREGTAGEDHGLQRAKPAGGLATRDESLGHLCRSLAQLHRKTGEGDRADAVSAQRIELWRHWAQKLPSSAFVTKQVAEAQSR